MLKEIKSMNAPKAIGPYSAAVELGDFVFVSGQLPIDPETSELVVGIEEQTHQVLKNIRALLNEIDLDFKHIVKTTIFIKNMDDFAKVNEIYSSYLSYPYPARSTIEVSALPKDALIEIECIAINTLMYEHDEHCMCEECNCDE